MCSNPASITFQTASGFSICVVPVASHTFHIRVNRTGLFEAPSPLTRLGIAAPPTSPVNWHTEYVGDALHVITDEAVLRLDRQTGSASLYDKSENLLTRQTKPPYGGGADGFGAQFALSDYERLYGLGDQYDVPLMKRGHTLSISLRSNRVHAPVPLLLSSNGWALLVDTDIEHEFDVGRSSPDELWFHGRRGELAYYLIAGGTLAELLGKHARLIGPSAMLPLWAYGLSFICNQQTTARDMIEDALKFRREGIPCDMIGLEPTWMDRPFDYEAPVRWHPEKFYIPQWMPEGAHTFMGALRTMGFKLSLGLYLPESPRPGTGTGSDDIGPSWYDYLEPFVAQGVQGFKLSTSVPVQEQVHLPAAEEDEEAESALTIAGAIGKIIQEGYAKQTGKRPIVYTPVGYIGVHKYAAMWSGGRRQPHLSVLGLGLSGIPNMSVDMNLHNPAGIHFGFFQPWSKVNSWAYWRHPLLLDADLLALFKTYAKLRYRLLPYIYSAASVSARTGLPIARAMPLAYPDDAAAVPLQNQYMFGDELLVAVFTDQVYLPDGEWIDYWTGDKYAGPAHITYRTPPQAGGPLFVRAGAIIPMWPDVEHAGQRPADRMELHLYPGSDRQYSFYEDDGGSLGYLSGESAETSIVCTQERGGYRVEIGPRIGHFRDMPEHRDWNVFIHTRDKPASVKVNGESWREAAGARKDPAPSHWSFNRRAGLIRLSIHEAAAGSPRPARMEMMYSAEKETRRSEPQPARYGGKPGKTSGELEKELEIGLETGDEAKALSALEQWWEVRAAGDRSPEDIREHWLYLNGLFVRSVERKGRTLGDVLGEDPSHRFQPGPDAGAGQAYEALEQMAKSIVEYDNKQRGRTNEIVRRATDIIVRELDQELSLQAVADRLHLNSSYLSRRFKKEIGMSFSDYVLEKKMELAKELLLIGTTVNATADRTGFKEASYFIRVFRKYWGVTPGEMKP
ncbi:TIM-barrel domain-containing protein [Paenibacillus hemerocallicola]|nr:TIM-barrel domain-containing protein [Paenibacillus hemerocallicola]